MGIVDPVAPDSISGNLVSCLTVISRGFFARLSDGAWSQPLSQHLDEGSLRSGWSFRRAFVQTLSSFRLAIGRRDSFGPTRQYLDLGVGHEFIVGKKAHDLVSQACYGKVTDARHLGKRARKKTHADHKYQRSSRGGVRGDDSSRRC